MTVPNAGSLSGLSIHADLCRLIVTKNPYLLTLYSFMALLSTAFSSRFEVVRNSIYVCEAICQLKRSNVKNSGSLSLIGCRLSNRTSGSPSLVLRGGGEFCAIIIETQFGIDSSLASSALSQALQSSFRNTLDRSFMQHLQKR